MLIVAYDGAQILDIACPSGALDIANRYGAEPPYSIELGTLGRRAARNSAGIVMGAGQGLERVAGHLDTLLVVGGIGCEDAASDERLLGQVRYRPDPPSDEDGDLVRGVFLVSHEVEGMAEWQVRDGQLFIAPADIRYQYLDE